MEVENIILGTFILMIILILYGVWCLAIFDSNKTQFMVDEANKYQEEYISSEYSQDLLIVKFLDKNNKQVFRKYDYVKLGWNKGYWEEVI